MTRQNVRAATFLMNMPQTRNIHVARGPAPLKAATASISRRAATKMKNSREHDRGFARGYAVALGIINSCFDQPRHCAEALRAAGYETRAKLKKAGADDYDLKLLRSAFSEIKRKGR